MLDRKPVNRKGPRIKVLLQTATFVVLRFRLWAAGQPVRSSVSHDSTQGPHAESQSVVLHPWHQHGFLWHQRCWFWVGEFSAVSLCMSFPSFLFKFHSVMNTTHTVQVVKPVLNLLSNQSESLNFLQVYLGSATRLDWIHTLKTSTSTKHY